ncbi:MAG: CRISPR-associated ring nuclease Csm6 [Gammaproteobacteria bacterium]
MIEPQQYPRRILLAVSGMSPQIVTETLYSLAVNNSNPFIPNEIHLITTLSGAKEAKLQLLHEETGKFRSLCQAYHLPDIEFSEENIYVIKDHQGKDMEDIKTPDQNESAADFISEIVRRLTSDDNAAIHVSIAGGRKTMGYYLGYALSLFGRNQDRLSHVLVTDRFEGLKDFFYPTPKSHVIEDKDGRSLDAKEAEVMLAEIPFVRLRTGIPEDHLTGKASFSESIKFIRQIEIDQELVIDKKELCFWINGVQVKPTPANFVYYLWILEHSLAGDPVSRSKNQTIIKNQADEYLKLCIQILGEIRANENTSGSCMEPNWMNDRNTAIKNNFEKALGCYSASPFLIRKVGGYNNSKYSIALGEDQIIYQ